MGNEVNIALHFLLKTQLVTHIFLCQNYALPFLILKLLSQFFFLRFGMNWRHLPGTVSCKRGRWGLAFSKNCGFCQVLSPTTYQFKKPTSDLTCSQR